MKMKKLNTIKLNSDADPLRRAFSLKKGQSPNLILSSQESASPDDFGSSAQRRNLTLARGESSPIKKFVTLRE